MGLLNNDIVRVSWRGQCFGQRVIMSQDYLILGDYNAVTSVTADLNDILANVTIGGAFNKTTRYLECLAPQYQLDEMRAQRIRTIRSSYVSIGFAATPGLWVGAATVANQTGTLTLRTAFAGRQYISNKHIGPTGDNANAAGLLTAAMRTALSNLGTVLIAAFAPAGSGSVVTPIVFHRATNTNTVVDRFNVGTSACVQRRRTVGLGE